MDLLDNGKKLWGENIPWLFGLREKGAMTFSKVGYPNSKTEAWKYSYFPTNVFDNLQINNNQHKCSKQCSCNINNDIAYDNYFISVCNGKLKDHHFDFCKGLKVKPLIEAIYDNEIKKYLNKSFNMEKFPFASLNTAFIEQGIVVLVEQNAKIDKPLYIHYSQKENNNELYCFRNIIIMESRSNISIIEHFSGCDNTFYIRNNVNEIFISNEAKLNHYKYINEANQAYHITLNSVIEKSNAEYKQFCAIKESAFTRNETIIKLQDKGACANVDGVYKQNDKGLSDITTNILHLAPHTISNQLVKGILDNNGKGVFQGKIHVAPDAQQIEGYQLHKALLLNDNAEVNCKPELEIYADDVKCSHGATSGNIDEEQLFYLQSRGISKNDAKKILIDAFLKETFDCVSEPIIKEWLKNKF